MTARLEKGGPGLRGELVLNRTCVHGNDWIRATGQPRSATTAVDAKPGRKDPTCFLRERIGQWHALEEDRSPKHGTAYENREE